jgi:DNA invertase Pin-like site-specific DNA recombinase
MKVALYARCSTSEQSVDLQLDGLREYAKARRFEVVAEYLDEGVSGAKASRPGLDQMLADARRGKFAAMLCWKLDRVGRSLHHLLNLLGELEALHVHMISLDDGLDSSTPGGRLFFQIRGAFAEYERSMTAERTAAGRAAAQRRGVRFGRPRVVSDAQRERLVRLRENGHSIRAIADLLGLHRSAVARELARLGSPAAGVDAATSQPAAPPSV